jgi:uncharacterized membrane protein YkvA (DUF1232 family)
VPFESIRKIIAAAADHEARTGDLAGLLRQTAKTQGRELKEDDVTALVAAVRGYVEAIPVVLEAMQNAARKAGIESTIAPFIRFVIRYFENPADVIPDREGLWGVLDDSYLARSVVSAVSEVVRAETGNPLVPRDLSSDNLSVRSLLGPRIAAELDALLANGLADPLVTSLSPQLAKDMGGFSRYVNDPIWGSAAIDEAVDGRLGAMGIF